MAHGHEVHTQTVPDPEGCTMHAELAFDTGVIVLGPEAGEEGGQKQICSLWGCKTWLIEFLRGVPSRRGLSIDSTARNSLYAGAWQLAEHGRDRKQRDGPGASPGGFRRRKSWEKKRRLGPSSATKKERQPTGASGPKMHASSCGDFTQTLTVDTTLGAGDKGLRPTSCSQ